MIGKRLKSLRESEHKSQQEVCSALNIEQSTLANYENDKRTPKIDILINLAEYYHVSVDYILGITDQPNKISNNEFPTKETLSNQLKALIKEQSDLGIEFYASVGHMDIATFQKYIDGEQFPSSFDLCKLVEIFDTSADYLFGKSTIAHPERNHFSISDGSNFSDRLRFTMDGNRLETELADELDISISKIRKLLNNEEMPSPKLLESISQILEKSTDYMLGMSKRSRKPDNNGNYPFHMDPESISRLQNAIGTEWDDQVASELGISNDELYMMYHFGFIPHISVLHKLCDYYHISADYLLNLSDSKLCIQITRECDEDDLIKNYRKLTKPYQKQVNGIIAEQLLQQERDNYMRSSVAADEDLKSTGTTNSIN